MVPPGEPALEQQQEIGQKIKQKLFIFGNIIQFGLKLENPDGVFPIGLTFENHRVVSVADVQQVRVL